MAAALNLPVRRIQKLLQQGAPDADDATAAADWSAHELSWRQWLWASPRHRGLLRRSPGQQALDAPRPGPEVAPLPSDGLTPLEAAKLRKELALAAKAELELHQARGQLVDRATAVACLTTVLHLGKAALGDLAAALALAMPATERDALRTLARPVVATAVEALDRRIRDAWRASAPPSYADPSTPRPPRA